MAADWKNKLRGLTGEGGEESGKAAVRAPLIEIFHSIQGEGRFVGQPTVFVRTATCPLRCLYCDTPGSYEAEARFPVRLGAREQHETNPVSAARAAELVRLTLAANPAGAGSPTVSLTGGEPLVFPEFVAAFGRALRQDGIRLHLETAAVDPDALAKCVQSIDHLSADYKLPETLGAPVSGPGVDAEGGYGDHHVKCCEIALRRGATVDVKIVLTAAVTDPGLERAFERLEPLRKKIQLILQPVTPFGPVTARLPRRDLERFAASAARSGFDLRVLPQVHKALRLP